MSANPLYDNSGQNITAVIVGDESGNSLEEIKITGLSEGMVTVTEPILLEVELSVEDYEFEVDPHEPVDFDTDTEINVIQVMPGGLPKGGNFGDIIIKKSSEDYDAEWVPPANSVEQDNTRPITAAAVYTEIGNINALLATI